MSNIPSTSRIKCVDPDSRHTKIQYQHSKTLFKPLGDLLKFMPLLYPNINFDETDKLCNYCYNKLLDKIEDLSSPEVSQKLSQGNQDVCCSQETSNREILQTKKCNEIEELNDITKELSLDLSPLKLPGYVTSNMKNSYVSRKRKQICQSFDSNVCKEMKTAYKVDDFPEYDEIKSACKKCNAFIENLKESLKNCSSYNEKIRLLSIIPKDYTKDFLIEFLPGITSHMLKKARSLEIYQQPDSYTAHPLSSEIISEVEKYYLDDDFECTRQSPNKNDTISVTIDGVKVKKVKRFTTRSVNEMYKVFCKNNLFLFGINFFDF